MHNMPFFTDIDDNPKPFIEDLTPQNRVQCLGDNNFLQNNFTDEKIPRGTICLNKKTFQSNNNNNKFEYYNKKLKLMATLDCVDDDLFLSNSDINNKCTNADNAMKQLRKRHELHKLPCKYKKDFLDQNFRNLLDQKFINLSNKKLTYNDNVINSKNIENLPSTFYDTINLSDEELMPLEEQREQILRMLANITDEDCIGDINDSKKFIENSSFIPIGNNNIENMPQAAKSIVLSETEVSLCDSTTSSITTINNSIHTNIDGGGPFATHTFLKHSTPTIADDCVGVVQHGKKTYSKCSWHTPTKGEIISTHISIPQIIAQPKKAGNKWDNKYKIDRRATNKAQSVNKSFTTGNVVTSSNCLEQFSTINTINSLPQDCKNLINQAEVMECKEVYSNCTDDMDEGEETDDDNGACEMLEEAVDKALAPLVYHKSVIKPILDKDDFEVLPDKWVEITHNSGVPIYLNKASRVCTLARPYFLGSASVRKHSVPLSGIPCLLYKRFSEKMPNSISSYINEPNSIPIDITEQTNCTRRTSNDSQSALGNEKSPNYDKSCIFQNTFDKHNNPDSVYQMSNAPLLNVQAEDHIVEGTSTSKISTPTNSQTAPVVTIESAEEAKQRHWITPSQLRKYCERRFEFHTITVRRFKTWADRRRHIKKIRIQRPSLHKSAKVVKCVLPTHRFNGQIVAKKKQFYFNPEDKTVLSILHEYVQNVLKTQVSYTFHTFENSKNPFGAKLFIKGVEYGVGYGSNKKNAKLDAARVALSVLNPEIAALYEKTQPSIGEGASTTGLIPSAGSALLALEGNSKTFTQPDTIENTQFNRAPQSQEIQSLKKLEIPCSSTPSCSNHVDFNYTESNTIGLNQEQQGTNFRKTVPLFDELKPSASECLPNKEGDINSKDDFFLNQKIVNMTNAFDYNSTVFKTPKKVEPLTKPLLPVTNINLQLAQSKKAMPLESSLISENQLDEEFDLFNELKITDPRIAELSIKAGQPTPYTILLECLKRNFGLTDSNIISELRFVRQNTHAFTLTVGKYTATVYCHSKKEGKHKAAQHILQKIHPQVANWGSILKLYGRTFTKELKHKKAEEESITSLQNMANNDSGSNQTPPNVQILSKLKFEMVKLYERKLLIRPIGTFFTPNSVLNTNMARFV